LQEENFILVNHPENYFYKIIFSQVGSDGGLLYPPNHGFGKSMETDLVLEPGTQIDRYGRNGRFFAPAGTPFEHRSLPPSAIKSDYTVYEVSKQ
jgi:hypothetical protein